MIIVFPSRRLAIAEAILRPGIQDLRAVREKCLSTSGPRSLAMEAQK